jgi:hypothetical protein
VEAVVNGSHGDGWTSGWPSSALLNSWSGHTNFPMESCCGYVDWSFEAELVHVSVAWDVAEEFDTLVQEIKVQRAQDAWTGNPDMTARQSDLGWYEGLHPDYLVQEYPVGDVSGSVMGWSPCQ